MRTWLSEGLAPLRDGYLKDVGRLLVVSVVVLSLAAAAAAWAVNAYFGETVSNLIGGVGQYDFMLHVGATSRARAARELASYLPKAFPGSRLKEGLTVAGQANFFLALPKEMRTRAVMENIDASLARVPGYSGHTTLVEPSIVVHGVAAGATGFFKARLENLPGVDLAFSDGQEIVAVVARGKRTEDVEQSVKALLAQYRLVEARFPMGYRVPDLAGAGEQVVEAVNRRYGKSGTITDVTRSDRDDDYRSFLASLTEMRRFLLSYTSDVTVKLAPGATVKPGDELVTGPGVPTPGERVGDDRLRVMVTGLEEGLAHAVAVQGDTTPASRAMGTSSGVIPAGRAFLIKPGNRVGAAVGTATIRNQRYALMTTVDESLKLLDRLQALAKHADTTAARVQLTLDSFQRTLDQIGQAQSALSTVKKGLSGPLDGLGKVPTGEVVLALNRAVAGIDDLLGKFGGITEAQAAMSLAAKAAGQGGNGAAGTQVGTPTSGQGLTGTAAAQAADVQGSVAGLAREAHQQTDLLSQIVSRVNPISVVLLKWRAQAQALAFQVGNFGLLAKNAGAVNDLIQGLSKATDSTMSTLSGVDVKALKADLGDISQKMEGIAQIDVGAVTRQMRYIQTSLPNLKDEELGRSVRLIDRYIGGAVIPGERLQFLVPAKLPLKDVLAEVKATAGDKATTAVAPAGSLKPDVWGVLFQVLGKVRSTVAALVAVALVVAVLALDHALIISALATGWRSRRLPRWWSPVAGTVYGTVVGATLLTVVFALSGARLPFFGWPATAGLGAVLGALAASLAGRLAPVNAGEFEAGQAMGMSYARLLREIVVPEGKPGLLVALNRRAVLFREPAFESDGARK